ncbi:MAG: hypothetical protein JO079_14660 [Frankiaceae bacterium]|nr:hypothetical protein [Frankiaceae bacterium]MBV9369473.1 hypothetical protein [Frankiales bacterium]
MPKYLVLYRSSATPEEQMSSGTPEQAQEGMALWMKWFEKTGPALIDFGSPVGKAQTLPGRADTGLPIGGYSIIEADSPEAAGKLLDDHPHLHAPDATLEVLEFLPMPGM